jgi:4-amino-4-deoxy-L-arabinose transferase-like glycosyltransferase
LAQASPAKRAQASLASRVVRPAAGFLACAASALLLMAHDRRLPFGVPLGALFVVGAAAFALRTVRAGANSSAVTLTSPRPLGAPLTAAAASALLFVASLGATARGVLPQWVGGAAITASFIATVAGLFALGETLGVFAESDERGVARPLLRRHGFWLLAFAAALYLPTLGIPSLWDPWESEYGEVAREILVRDDWISLWFAHEAFFYSKPVLIFWTQALAMAGSGMRILPGEVLAGGAHPEWVIRMPNALFALLGLYVLYRGLARTFGRRPALMSTLVLATSAHWFLLAHQSITDMPFVASMSAAMGLVLLGLKAPEGELARVYEARLLGRTVRVSAWHLCFGAILVCALPQALYLVSRNVELVLHGAGPYGFRPHADEFLSGSGGGNCGEPGNPACTHVSPAHAVEPFVQGLIWLAGLATVLWMNRGERRSRQLYFLGAWFFAAISGLAKGPAGVGLPVLSVFVALLATRRLGRILEMQAVSGALIVAVVALPWYIAMYIRHGQPFTDELIFHDMVNRAFSHVHDTNEGSDTGIVYYVEQLGWGLFPWTAIAPLGLVFWLRERDTSARGGEAHVLLIAWFLIAFALFTLMGTKFHHYILPAVPPAAILTGLALDALWGGTSSSGVDRAALRSVAPSHERRMLGAAAVCGAFAVALVGRDLARHAPGEQDGAIHFAQLFSYQYHRPWPVMLDLRAPLIACAALVAVALVSTVFAKLRRPALAGLFGVAALFAVWCGDVYLAKTGKHWGQGEVLRAYYANRASEAEPLVAYQMNWKGENFYTGNRVATFVSTGAPFTKWVTEQKEHGTKALYFVLEHSRVGGLKREVGARTYTEVTTQENSHEFVLVRADL